MPNDCIFCQIVAGDIPSKTVYEDESVLAFLDVNPLAPGHTLVISKDHHETLDDLPDDAAADLFSVLHGLTPAVETAVDADASNVAFNNGGAAGQEVPHVHGHIIPRFDGDGGHPIHAIAGDRPDLSDEELDAIADDIRDGR
ncbi:histidine triad protein [Haladaptatus paucihalophilus DX253]|uniref:Histidine triad (HIT) family protein n=1 Tax=Haladaptatus paucihalophilus DX253 TaxID=797209 RepID=E7QNT9_HALPU|nr:HIT family protein [Haladaptatus paucihalophilus]EFW93592.1 histidine triad protein [Haladaptatus paucihalophilus DX253]SHL44777.1 histidine triad (HIT) family protein [Haladaptatus paucihalophilus DX253]